jgi:DnaJ-class molecular chaperone
MPRLDVATDSDSCPECGARFIVAPCRSCKGKGQTLLFLKCKDCGGIGKKMVCPNFLSHLRAQSGSQTPANGRGDDRPNARNAGQPLTASPGR